MISPVRVREVVESDEPRLLEINADIGGSPEDEIHDFVPPQPIMDRMPVGVSPPKEGLRMRDVIAQSTPTTLSRGPQQFGQGAFRKPKVTFATTPFKEKEAVRCGPSGITPGSGGRRKTVFEDNFLGRRSSWERTPEKGPEKHTALIGVRSLTLALRSGGKLTTAGLGRDSERYRATDHTSIRGCGGGDALCEE